LCPHPSLTKTELIQIIKVYFFFKKKKRSILLNLIK